MLSRASASAKPRLFRGRRCGGLVARAEQSVDERLGDAVVETLAVADRRRLLLDEVLHLARVRVAARGVGALHAAVVVQQRGRPVLLARPAALHPRVEVTAEEDRK